MKIEITDPREIVLLTIAGLSLVGLCITLWLGCRKQRINLTEEEEDYGAEATSEDAKEVQERDS